MRSLVSSKPTPLNSPAISGRMLSMTHFLIWLFAHTKLHTVHPVQQLQLFSVGHQKLRQIQIELSYLTIIAKLLFLQKSTYLQRQG